MECFKELERIIERCHFGVLIRVWNVSIGLFFRCLFFVFSCVSGKSLWGSSRWQIYVVVVCLKGRVPLGKSSCGGGGEEEVLV